MPNLMQGLLLMLLGATVMLTVSIAVGTRLSTITTGIVAFGIYGIAFLGGWIEQIGTAMPSEPARLATRNIGTVASLLSPTDVLWRLVVFGMLPPAMRSFPTPFSSNYPPSAAMVAWAGAYVVVMLAIVPPVQSAALIMRQVRSVARTWKGFSLAKLRALRGFAVNPGPDFHREAAQDAKKRKGFSFVAVMPLRVYLCSSVVSLLVAAPLRSGTLRPLCEVSAEYRPGMPTRRVDRRILAP